MWLLKLHQTKGRQRPQSANIHDYDKLKRAYDDLEAKYRQLLAGQSGGRGGQQQNYHHHYNQNEFNSKIDERAEEDYASE